MRWPLSLTLDRSNGKGIAHFISLQQLCRMSARLTYPGDKMESNPNNERRWLWDSADAILRPSESEKSFHELYDQLLWEVVTSTTEELQKLADKMWDHPYRELPTSIIVTICRILSTGLAPDREMMQNYAASGVTFCDPGEEEGFLSGYKRLQPMLPDQKERNNNALH